MKLDTSALKTKVNRLDEGVKGYQLDMRDEQTRDGLIQRFAFAYELLHKIPKRYLAMTIATPNGVDFFFSNHHSRSK